ncbi:hypothetical protein [Algoriphagus sp. PAP.12]|uniref:hypothetical protein n=1 Tax=Algoriphagus sp. PAP.12 TaxID=2996678 RepID=UPI00227A6ACA|nr:hypothetical protein [Algoriphagus sp. PAP.12]
MEALKFSSFNQAKTHFDIINNKKSKMIDLEIKRAENDIWWGTWGKLVSIIGTFLGIILGAIANQYNWFGLF